MTPETFKNIFSTNIKKYRKLNHFTQMSLAEKANISVGYLCDLEAGNKWGTPETITKLATALNISPSQLFISDSDDNTNTITDDLLLLSEEIKENIDTKISDLQKKYIHS